MIMKDVLKKSIKKIIPKSIKKFLRYSLFPFNSSIPFLYKEPIFDNFNVSDYFLFRCDDFETLFIAENNLALVLAKPILCKHKFYFYNKQGDQCGFYETTNENFHFNLKINKEIVGDELIGSFIHQTEYLDSNINILLSSIPNFPYFQHRGYTGYRKKDTDDNLFSFMHGNFGAMYIKENKLKSLAIQRQNQM